MDKLAKTKDPKRQALRVRKNEWNKSTKKFIGDFIALKKGINGTGDSKHGIPPTAIDHAFPGQIGSFINELASSAAKIIEEARKISEEQANYASSVDKKASANSEAELVKLAELVAHASWWGSRALSRFKLKDPQKRHIVKMIYSLVDIFDTLKKFESDLLTLNRVKVPDAFTTLNTIVKKYIAVYIDSLNSLQNFLPDDLRKQLQEPDYIKNLLKARKEEEQKRIQEEKAQAQEAKRSEKSEEETEELPEGSGKDENKGVRGLSSLELLQSQINPRIKELTDDFQNAEVVILAILNHPDIYTVDDNLKNSLARTLEEYRENYELFVHGLKGGKKLTAPQFINQAEAFKRLYEEIRKNVNKVKINMPYSEESGFGKMGEGKTLISQLKINNNSSFFDLLMEIQRILPDQSGLTVAFNLVNYSLIKEASFQNWLRSKYIGLNLDPIKVPDSFDIAQLNIYEQSKELRKNIQSTLDELEDPSTSIVRIFEISKIINELIIKMLSSMFKLGDIYSSFLRRSDKVKNQYKIDIKYQDLNELKQLKNILENIKFIDSNILSLSSGENEEE